MSDWFSIWRIRSRVTLNVAPDLVQRARRLAAEAVAKLEYAPFAAGEVLKRVSQGFIGQDRHGALVGRLGLVVGDELAELGLLLVADRFLERDRRSRVELYRLDLVGLDAGHVGDVLGRRLAAERGVRLRSARPIWLSFSTMLTGIRIVRALSASARVTAWRIHQVA